MWWLAMICRETRGHGASGVRAPGAAGAGPGLGAGRGPGCADAQAQTRRDAGARRYS